MHSMTCGCLTNRVLESCSRRHGVFFRVLDRVTGRKQTDNVFVEVHKGHYCKVSQSNPTLYSSWCHFVCTHPSIPDSMIRRRMRAARSRIFGDSMLGNLGLIERNYVSSEFRQMQNSSQQSLDITGLGLSLVQVTYIPSKIKSSSQDSTKISARPANTDQSFH